MVMTGETIFTGANDKCFDCNVKVINKVMRSAAGFYIGTSCETDGCILRGHPYSRESGYYKTEKEAETALENGGYERYFGE